MRILCDLCQSLELLLREIVCIGKLVPHFLQLVVPGAVCDKRLDFEHLAVDLAIKVQL